MMKRRKQQIEKAPGNQPHKNSADDQNRNIGQKAVGNHEVNTDQLAEIVEDRATDAQE